MYKGKCKKAVNGAATGDQSASDQPFVFTNGNCCINRIVKFRNPQKLREASRSGTLGLDNDFEYGILIGVKRNVQRDIVSARFMPITMNGQQPVAELEKSQRQTITENRQLEAMGMEEGRSGKRHVVILADYEIVVANEAHNYEDHRVDGRPVFLPEQLKKVIERKRNTALENTDHRVIGCNMTDPETRRNLGSGRQGRKSPADWAAVSVRI